MTKDENFVWAVTKLKERLDAGIFGKVVFNVQGGIVQNMNVEEKINVDATPKTP